MTKKLLIQALDRCASGTLVVDARDPRGAIVYANEAFRDLTGWDTCELVGQCLRDFVVAGDLPGPQTPEVDQRWRGRGTSPVSLRLRVAPLYQRPGLPDYWLLSHPGPAAERGVRQRGEAARTDAVTGLPDRRVFDDVLYRDWGMARRDQRRLAVMLFRVDALESYRDVFGRHSADACLRKVAHAISGALHRAGDLAARLDAERFGALVGDMTEAEVEAFAADIAERVRGLAIHHPRSPMDRFVTVSTGVAVLVPGREDPAELLLERAAEALQAGTAPAAAKRASG